MVQLGVTLLPDMRGFERRRTVTDRAGIMIVSRDASEAVIAIGSGQYRFSTA